MSARDAKVAVEFFAAKGTKEAALFMSVPHQCGLSDADTVMLNGNQMLAMRQQSILSIDFSPLSDDGRANLLALADADRQLLVAEFMASGLANAYFLDLVVAG